MTKRVVAVEFGDQNTLLIDAGRARKIHACRSAQIVLKMEIMKITILICSGFFLNILSVFISVQVQKNYSKINIGRVLEELVIVETNQ